MARKVEQSVPPLAADADDSLVALHPNMTITVAGRAVTMREYGFFEGLEVAARCPGFIASIAGMVNANNLSYARVRRLFGLHRGEVVHAAATAANVEVEWVDALQGADAELFISTWFGVTGGFFVHEAVQEVVELRGLQPANPTPTSGTASSPNSPLPDSATLTNSDAAQNGS
uniref:DUF6631 family protein n=1 Tax=Xanthomonas albilineans TaxID=29447 RepID=UPI0027DABFAC|nr:DUF6631 family protein [Xanthomonas albilineans]